MMSIVTHTYFFLIAVNMTIRQSIILMRGGIGHLHCMTISTKHIVSTFGAHGMIISNQKIKYTATKVFAFALSRANSIHAI